MPAGRTTFEFCDTPPPFPPGESPFHIKGQFYLQQMRWFERLKERQNIDVVARLSPELQRFCSQRFLAATWYDALPFPFLTMCEASSLGQDAREVAKQQAGRSAAHALKGVYKMFIPILLPNQFVMRSVGGRMISAVSQFYDFGPCRVLDTLDPRTLVMRREGVPLPMLEWWSINASTFIVSALQLLKVAVTHKYEYGPTRSDRGVPVGHVTITITR